MLQTSFSRETPTSAQSLITSRPRARSYASRERKLMEQKRKRERQIIDRSFDGSFGEFGPFLWDLWSFEWNGRLQSPQPSHFSHC